MQYSDFLAVENWEIIDRKMCHFFNEDETPFEAICVKIGTLTTYKSKIMGATLEKSPILRWISSTEYFKLLENSGVIVF